MPRGGPVSSLAVVASSLDRRGIGPQHWIAAFGALVVALAGLLTLLTSAAADSDTPTATPASSDAAGSTGPVMPLPRPSAVATTSSSPAGTVPVMPLPRPTTTSARTPAPRPLRISFIGDSVAWSTAAAMKPHAGNRYAVINHGIWGCGVVRGTPFRYFGSTKRTLPNDCEHWPLQWQRRLDRDRPHVVVIMVGRWELMDRVHDGRWTHVGDPTFDAYLARELDKAIRIAGKRARVVVATTPYYRRGDAPGGATWPEDVPARVDKVNALLRAAAERNDVAVVDFGGPLSPGGRLAMEVRGTRLRTDGVHIAADAGPWLASWLLGDVARAAGY